MERPGQATSQETSRRGVSMSRQRCYNVVAVLRVKGRPLDGSCTTERPGFLPSPPIDRGVLISGPTSPEHPLWQLNPTKQSVFPDLIRRGVALPLARHFVPAKQRRLRPSSSPAAHIARVTAAPTLCLLGQHSASYLASAGHSCRKLAFLRGVGRSPTSQQTTRSAQARQNFEGDLRYLSRTRALCYTRR